MTRPILTSGAPQRVEPRRKRKRSSGERAQRAAQLAARIETTARERQSAWSETGLPEVTDRATRALDLLHDGKRRAIADAPTS